MRWGREGLKLVHCAITSNPSMDKAEKQECVDMATKMYDQLDDAGKLKKQGNNDEASADSGKAGSSYSYDALKKTVSGVVGSKSESTWSGIKFGRTKDNSGSK